MSFGVRVDIRLDSLKHNLELLHAAQPDSKVLAAVKANAYGHGLVTVSRAISDSVDAFAVARMAEAVKLRSAGVLAPIVLMGGGTGLIGDPSGKDSERTLATRER